MTFDSAGPVAHSIALQAAWLFVGGAIVFIAVMLLLAMSLRRARAVHVPLWMIGGGVVLPVLLLTPLWVDGVQRSAALSRAAPADALLIGVTARMWWWELRYADPAGGPDIVTANELHVPAGRPVRLALSSADVIHSVWVPALAGKMDVVPGRMNHLQFSADRPGVHSGACAEYCGEQHARMALRVVALEPQRFDDWLRTQRTPAAAPQAEDAQVKRGREAFVRSGCASCHRIAGVAAGRLGPDLSHVASRHTLGAMFLRNDAATLRAWITDVQAIKPGARMPSFSHLDAPTLDALVAYLATLR